MIHSDSFQSFRYSQHGECLTLSVAVQASELISRGKLKDLGGRSGLMADPGSDG